MPVSGPTPVRTPSAGFVDDLLQLPWPADLAPATLAMLVRAGDGAGAQAWQALFADRDPARLAHLAAGLQAVPATQQLPGFERLLTRCAALPLAERESLRRQAHRIVLADGQLSLVEIWRCLLLDHVLGLARESVLRETHARSLAQCASAIHVIGATLAWQQRDVPAQAAALAEQWCRQASTALEIGPAPVRLGNAAPVLAAIDSAMQQLARLAPMRRPQLLKTWYALVRDDPQPTPQGVWDSLRCICLLIDTPLPPDVQARFA